MMFFNRILIAIAGLLFLVSPGAAQDMKKGT